MKPTIQCSHCGKLRYVSLSDGRNNVVNVARKWKSCGTALYCPECVKKIKYYSPILEVNLMNILQIINSSYELIPRERDE